MANKMKLEIYGFEEMITKLDAVGANVKDFVTESLEAVGEDVGVQTKEALTNLPAGGKYSTGDTEASVVTNPKVEWQGSVASIGMGFDYMKPGAGGFLISGTPRMRPVQGLVSIYKRKTFWKKMGEGLQDSFEDYFNETMGG